MTRVVEGRTHRLSLEPDALERGGRLDGSPARPLGAPVRCRRRVPEGGSTAMNMPPIVSPQEWEAAREELLVKEKELTRARDALAAERRRMPRMAVEKDYALRGPGRPGEPARPVRGAPPADRLPLLLRARRGRLARERLPRLLVRRRPGRPPRAPERPRHHARVRLARAAGGHRALEGADGLGRSPGTRSPTTSTPTSASTSGTAPTPSSATTTTGSSAPTSSTAAATRRWAAPGATSTSPRSAARRSGRTRPRATRRPRPTSGGTCHDEYDEPTASRRPRRSPRAARLERASDRPRRRRAGRGDRCRRSPARAPACSSRAPG